MTKLWRRKPKSTESRIFRKYYQFSASNAADPSQQPDAIVTSRHVTAGCPPFLCFWVNWVAALAIVVCYDQSGQPSSFPKLIPSSRIYYCFISCTAVLCFPVISKLL